MSSVVVVIFARLISIHTYSAHFEFSGSFLNAHMIDLPRKDGILQSIVPFIIIIILII